MRRQILSSVKQRSPVDHFTDRTFAQFKASLRSNNAARQSAAASGGFQQYVAHTHNTSPEIYGVRKQAMSSIAMPATAASNTLVIFDKDGTLIDFQSMWKTFVETITWKIEKHSNMDLRERLFEMLGYDSQTRQIKSKSRLSDTTLTGVFDAVVSTVKAAGISEGDATELVKGCWTLPDPVRNARPMSDLPTLFNSIRHMGAKIAVITLDERERTEAMLGHLGIDGLVDGVACGDDEVPMKPNPEQVWALCRSLNVSPSQTIVVGDTNSDMVLARQAGCALSVGVMGGSTDTHDLAKDADVLIPSIDNVLQFVVQYAKH